MPEIATAYTLCYGHWTVIPHHLRDSFEDMVDCGFTHVALSFSESEMVYSRRAFELQIELAHRAGLKVLAVPSRIGGRFAGAPLMPSIWLAKNPEHAVQLPGWMPVGCLESPPFVDWIKSFMATLLTDYDIDGLIWDEPKGLGVVSDHPATIERFGPNPTAQDMIDSFLSFLADLNQHCLSLKPGLVNTLFCQKTDPPSFTERAAAIQGLAYHGYDGNLQRESFFHEPAQWHKYRLEEVWPRTVAECEASGAKTFSLVENMLMPAEAIDEFEANFAEYLRGPLPDHLAIYYYAHNNEDPERVHDIVRRLMKQHL